MKLVLWSLSLFPFDLTLRQGDSIENALGNVTDAWLQCWIWELWPGLHCMSYVGSFINGPRQSKLKARLQGGWESLEWLAVLFLQLEAWYYLDVYRCRRWIAVQRCSFCEGCRRTSSVLNSPREGLDLKLWIVEFCKNHREAPKWSRQGPLRSFIWVNTACSKLSSFLCQFHTYDSHRVESWIWTVTILQKWNFGPGRWFWFQQLATKDMVKT